MVFLSLRMPRDSSISDRNPPASCLLFLHIHSVDSSLRNATAKTGVAAA